MRLPLTSTPDWSMVMLLAKILAFSAHRNQMKNTETEFERNRKALGLLFPPSVYSGNTGVNQEVTADSLGRVHR